MSFGTIIKKLRRERELTQEELAEILSISPQAISRWETDVAMPDISLIPTLCNYFSVSADMLLGIDIDRKKQKINALLEEAGKYSFRGYYEEARKILKAGLREYPDSCEITKDLMYVSFWQHKSCAEKSEYCDEAIRLGEFLLDKCTVDSLRYSAIRILCYCYRDTGRIDDAARLARTLPYIADSSEILLSSIYSGDKGYSAKQSEAYNLLHFLAYRLTDMQEKLDSGKDAYTDEELVILRDKQIALFDLFFEDGNYGFYNTFLWNTHISQAAYYLNKTRDTVKALEHIRAAAENAIEFLTSAADDYRYTSLVFRGRPRGAWCGSDTDNDAKRLLEILDSHTFDLLRGSAELEEIEAGLREYAGKWQVE